MKIYILILLFLFPLTLYPQEGIASFYGTDPIKEHLNSHTAMNIPFCPELMECASYAFPLGTVLKVTNIATGDYVIVRCVDRGPSPRLNRLIDLTRAAFEKIAPLEQGLCEVEVEVYDPFR